MEEMLKYKVCHEDWRNLNLVEMKHKAESIVALFTVLENLIAPNVSPEQMEILDEAKCNILECYDEHIDRHINSILNK